MSVDGELIRPFDSSVQTARHFMELVDDMEDCVACCLGDEDVPHDFHLYSVAVPSATTCWRCCMEEVPPPAVDDLGLCIRCRAILKGGIERCHVSGTS